MTKEQLISSVSEKSGLTKKDSKLALESLISTIEEVLQSGDKIQLIGFGTFDTREVAEKSGVCGLQKDEQGNKIEIPYTTEAHRKPFLKFGKTFKEKVAESNK